jgi:hypothetical protein
MLPVEVSVNVTASGAVPDVGVAVKFATSEESSGGVKLTSVDKALSFFDVS